MKRIESPWKVTQEICEYLHVSRQTLNKNMKKFSYGVHYFRNDPSNPKSKILWHLERIEKFFCTPVAPKVSPKAG